MKHGHLKPTLYLLLILGLLLPAGSFAQSYAKQKERIKKQIKQSQVDIQYADALLNLNAQNKKLSLQKLALINRKIQLRERLLQEVNEQIVVLNKLISTNTQAIIGLESDIDILKTKYANSIKIAYKYRNKDKDILHLLSSDNYDQAYKRMVYFKAYTRNRRNQALKLRAQLKLLKRRRSNLAKDKAELLNVMDLKNSEKYELEIALRNKKSYISKLDTRSKRLKDEINYKKNLMLRLNKKIALIIKQEIKEEQARLARQKKNKKSQKKYTQLSSDFGNRKGKLVRPVNGAITSKFGKHRHPVIRSIYIENNGVDIKSKPKAKVKVCYDGVVKKIFAIPGRNQAVMVRHGKYLSVYSNVENIRVEIGDKVRAGEVIASLPKTNEESELHFEIWKEMKKLNPQEWVRF